jgi:predicted ATPase
MKQFQSFRLVTANHCLWSAENRVSLTPKAFDVLRYLVEHPGRLVTQDEILEALWPEAYVNPELVKKYILGIRKVLGDSPDKPVFIETIPKRGYQFVAPVSDESTAGSADLPSDSKKMVGRDESLSKLNTHLERTLRGQRQIIFVTGEAGIGKTTLVDVFHQEASRRPNLRLARGQCVEGFGGKEAYYPVLEAIGQLVRDSDRSPVAQILAKQAPTWWIQFPALVKAEKREALQREILGATRERMVREICEALEAITAESPLVLIFEDLHWVDDSTLDLISALARRREPAKLMLLGTYRPADVVISKTPLKGLKQDLQVHRLCTEVAIERLEEPEIAEYLATEFPNGNLPAALAKLIYRHSGGNALFMVAIVQDMVKKGLIAQEEGRWKLTQALEDIEPGVPETLQQMLEVQFEQLSSDEQRVLKSASVAGERFSGWAISPTLEMAPERIEDVCEGLSERGQFIRSAGFQELEHQTATACYEFRHSLYRQMVYRALSDVTRARLHRSVGQRLLDLWPSDKSELPSELALHFEQGREYERAIDFLIVASENIIKRFAYRDSIQVLQHGLSLVPQTPPAGRAKLEIKILDRMGDAYYAQR